MQAVRVSQKLFFFYGQKLATVLLRIRRRSRINFESPKRGTAIRDATPGGVLTAKKQQAV
jgi:hypothetical protein